MEIHKKLLIMCLMFVLIVLYYHFSVISSADLSDILIFRPLSVKFLQKSSAKSNNSSSAIYPM